MSGKAMPLRCGRFVLDLQRPLLMGVVNITTDSFSGDGHRELARAVEHALGLVEEGADILDLGAESSRPGAAPVCEEDELARIVPLVSALRHCSVPLSIDTTKPRVMHAALAAGADMINDISALEAPGALEVLAAHPTAAVCLMHMRGTPQSMQEDPRYENVVADVKAYLSHRADVAEQAGIARNRLVLDPGFGFGKSQAHNLELFQNLQAFRSLGLPLLVGVSRKTMLGRITGRPVTERMVASVAAAMLAAQAGAAIVRVHDVSETKDALAVWEALKGNN